VAKVTSEYHSTATTQCENLQKNNFIIAKKEIIGWNFFRELYAICCQAAGGV
jgi:hypothetical protein